VLTWLWAPGGRFSRRWCSRCSAGCGLEVDELLGRGDRKLGEQVSLGLGEGGDLLVSMIRMSRRASQQRMTWARMRSSSR
jgi:hypothetical protein